VVAFLALFAVVGLQPVAGALSNGPVPPPPTAPTSADQIQNIDQVKTAIKGYYGDKETEQLDPVTGTVKLHTFDPNGSYAQEVRGLAADAGTYLDRTAKKRDKRSTDQAAKPAVVFDVDDTTLNTYNYEIYSSFVYNPAQNAAFVNSASFPAVPGMVELEHQAEQNGYTVFFLTGRPESQRAGTVMNLVNEGYDVAGPNLYLKDLTKDTYASCYQPPTRTCTTTEYKSLTRQSIESQGYDIVASFGDQYSDLNGGFADRTFKVPNPMYYLP
jgi:hypothetical protein